MSPSLLRLDDCKDWFESRPVQVAFSGLLWLYVAIQIVSALAVPLGGYDGSLPLVSADLINRGRLPQVDFSAFYPPLEQYCIAFMFRFAGRTVLAHRFLCAALFIVVVIAANRFFKLHAVRFRSLAPLMTLLVVVGIGASIQLAPWPGFAVAFLTLLTYFMSRETLSEGIPWNTVLAGLLAGVATLIRFNFGIYVAVVVLLDLLVWDLQLGHLHLKRRLLSFAAFVVPLFFLNAIFYLAVYGAQGVSALLGILAAGPASGRSRFIDLPRSWPLSALFLPYGWFSLKMIVTDDRLSGRSLVPLIPAVSLVGLAFAWRANPSVAAWLTVLGILTVLVLQMFVFKLERAEFGFVLYLVCLLHYYLYRFDVYHAWPVFLMMAMVIPFLIITPVQGRRASFGMGIAFVLLMASMALTCMNSDSLPHASLFMNGLRLIKRGGLSLRISDGERYMTSDPISPWLFIYPHQSSTWDTPGLDEFQTVRFIRSNTGPADAIFVGLKDHSKVFMNDVRIYWLTERLPGSRYIDLEPWVTPTESAQREIVSDLERSGTNWAILEGVENVLVQSSIQRSRPPGSKLLDQFFLANFQEVASFGRLSVLRRKHP